MKAGPDAVSSPSAPVGGHRQAVGILDLPLPTPPPAEAEWTDAFRHWAL